MITVNKISADEVIDFAALELKKYLKMMMPEGDDVTVTSDKSAVGGFRLGLMQDVGLFVGDVEDTELDDIIYIDCDTEGGLILGDNPRSVLLAVYEYLRLNGCRWLFPGVDGELIPRREIGAVKKRLVPPCRYRGNCIEGAVEQRMLNEYIDFLPKVGLNTFMLQFRIPSVFYKRYYEATNNESNRRSKPVCDGEITSLTRLTECEMAKRGIMLHSCGHGWTVDPFGIDARLAWKTVDDSEISDDTRQYLAMTDGKRQLFGGKPANTQFCMSNPVARKKVADFITDYAENHKNVHYLHVWLADASNNHCECDECKTKLPSDWYIDLMNELDVELSARALKTKIVFIVYLDTVWAPLTERIVNKDRFTMMLAPISRDYSKRMGEDLRLGNKPPYVRNKPSGISSLDDYLLHLEDWHGVFDGSVLCFEYHFWRHLHLDLSGLDLARHVYDDNAAYRRLGLDGVIECGSQRTFFPNGLVFYTHARSLFEGDVSFDGITEDYFFSLYGDGWQTVYDYLRRIGDLIPFDAVEHAGHFGFDDEVLDIDLGELDRIVKEGAALIESRKESTPQRVRSVALWLLERHAELVTYVAELIKAKKLGNTEGVSAALDKIRDGFGRHEDSLLTFYDAYQAVYSYKRLVK